MTRIWLSGCSRGTSNQTTAATASQKTGVYSEFRRRNLDALSDLFVQILRLCQKAGMVSLGHVALDGIKVQANASKHMAMSHERMLKAEWARRKPRLPKQRQSRRRQHAAEAARQGSQDAGEGECRRGDGDREGHGGRP